ncbi:MAG: carboxypeptidase-like regulatory domain-containing protein [Thermoanaerobaculia bacterium]
MNTSPIRAALIAVLIAVPLTSAASGHLDVSIQSAGKVTSGWLAVVRADAPHSEPSFEQRVTAGRRFTADLPEGRYYAGLATAGGELDVRPITIVAGQTTSGEWTLRGAPSQRGRVYDEQGAPVAGATVAQLRAVLHPWVGLFSAEALQALAAGWSATTDEEGAWALPVSSRERIPCIVSKQGKTPVVLDLAESSPPPDVVLQEGRELRLTFDDPDAGAVLHLEPLDPERLQPELARWMERYSTRTETKVVHWDALPPGRYRVSLLTIGRAFSSTAWNESIASAQRPAALAWSGPDRPRRTLSISRRAHTSSSPRMRAVTSVASRHSRAPA